MGWVVRGPDGDMSFDTHAEAMAYEEALKSRDTRTPDEIWASAGRPRVSRETFDRRMRMGWAADRALYTAPDGRYLGATMPGQGRKLTDQLGGPNAELYEMLGRKRTLADWSLSSGVSVSRLDKGIKRHGSLQAYLLLLGWYPGKPAATTPDPE